MVRPSQSGRAGRGPGHGQGGFTLFELVVVLFILALLAALAVPSIQGGMTRAKETALRHDLSVMRAAIGDYRADRGAWPGDLEALVSARYLDSLPEDPVSDAGTGWDLVPAEDAQGIADVRSRSDAEGTDGRAYSEW